MRRDLFAWRDHSQPCEHGVRSAHHVWVSTSIVEPCLGGVPLFTECGTCDWDGTDYLKGACPDCHGLGAIPTTGTIERRCSMGYSPSFCATHQHASPGCGWVLVIPLEES